MNKKTFIVIAFVIIALAALFFAPRLFKQKQVEAAEVDIVLEVVSGSAVVKSSDGGELNIKQGISEVSEGDIVKTEEGTLAILYFSDDTLMRLDENTEVKIETYYRKDKTLKVAIWLQLGRTWSRVERIIETDSQYEVRTLNTVAAVRGTSFGESRMADRTELIGGKQTVEVQAIEPTSRQPLAGGFVRLGEKERVQIIDSQLPTQETPLVVEKLSAEALQEKWIKFNLEEDERPLSQLKIGEKTEAIRTQKSTADAPKIIFIEQKPEWQQPELLEKINLLNAETQQDSTQPSTQKPAAQTQVKPPPSPVLPELAISKIEPNKGVGDSYVDYIPITIYGSGFSSIKSIFLGSVSLQNINIVNQGSISAKIPGSIQHGIYNLTITREDGAKKTLPSAFEALKPVGQQ